MFKVFKAKVELQLGKPIKAVKSDRGGEFYGKYDETGRNPGPFAKFQWGCRKEESHIVGYVPNKSVPKTPYEPWSGKKLSLHHFHVWGCKAEVSGSRGSKFYCPFHTTRIIESDKVVYFEDEVNVDPNFVPREIPFGFPTSHVPNMDVPIVQQPATNQGEQGDQVESGIPVGDTVVDRIPLRRS
ncbi:hypothetical protein AAG906_017082 [Vitis piasezkii]